MTTMEQPLTQVKTPPPGVYHNVPFTEYARWNAVNWHTLEPYRVTAKNGRKKQLTWQETKDHQNFGAAFHCANLEPARFAEEYAVMPEFPGHHNSKDYKNAVLEWEASNSSKAIITHGEYSELLAMQATVYAHPVASAILSGEGRNEISILWIDKETGILCKCRLDRVARVPLCKVDPSAQPNKTGLVLADLKSTRRLSLDSFNRDRANFGYHGQIAMQMDGLQSHDPAQVLPVLIAIHNEGEDAFVCDMRELIGLGRDLWRGLLHKYAKCLKEKRWPGVSDFMVSLPAFAWESRHPCEVTSEED